MLVREITYEDLNGQMRTETFYFNLRESELSEFTFSEEGGLLETLKKIVETQSMPKIVSYFKKIILMSYGEKSADGRRLIKSEELSKAFSETGAYDKLFMELFSDPKKFNEFIKQVVPANMRSIIEEEEAKKKSLDAVKAKADITALPGMNG